MCVPAVSRPFLFVLCTIPFWTSNVIRMISWVPLLGRNGLVNENSGQGMGVVEQPVEWLLFSNFSVVLAFVHLYTMFMIVPIFNSMMRIDRSLIEAASDSGRVNLADAVERDHPVVPDRNHHRFDLRHHHRDGRLRHHRRDGRAADRLGRQDHSGADVVSAVSSRRRERGDFAGSSC